MPFSLQQEEDKRWKERETLRVQKHGEIGEET
jgi:hypothetical protein